MIERLLAGAAGVALVLGLGWMYGNARAEAGALEERSKWERAATVATAKAAGERLALERRIADERVAGERGVRVAAESYAARMGELGRLAFAADRESERYATTDEGRGLCLTVERVRAIAAADAGLGLVVAAPGAPDAAGTAGGAPRDLLSPAARPLERRDNE